MGASIIDMAFEATDKCFHDCVPTYRANRLTVSSNLAASFAVPHEKITYLSPNVGAVNFLGVAAPDPPDPAVLRYRVRHAFFAMISKTCYLQIKPQY